MKRLMISLCVCLALVTGCGWTASDLPLPGGGLSGPTYELSAEFEDVLNLPDKAKVTMDGVKVGEVREITVEGYTATVTFDILEEFRLPRGTTLELRQATALGEVFVAVNLPRRPGKAVLHDGDTIPVADTGSAPSIEDTLAALSTLLNGGGLSNLKVIIDEVNAGFDGRVAPTRHLMVGLRDLLATIHGRSRAINRVLDSMDALTRQVLAHQPAVDALLRDVRPAVRELARQRKQFVEMLTRFDSLARSGRDLIDASQHHAVRMLDRLGPVLDGFIALDEDLDPSLRRMMALYRALARSTEGNTLTAVIRVLGVKQLPVVGDPPVLREEVSR